MKSLSDDALDSQKTRAADGALLKLDLLDRVKGKWTDKQRADFDQLIESLFLPGKPDARHRNVDTKLAYEGLRLLIDSGQAVSVESFEKTAMDLVSKAPLETKIRVCVAWVRREIKADVQKLMIDDQVKMFFRTYESAGFVGKLGHAALTSVGQDYFRSRVDAALGTLPTNEKEFDPLSEDTIRIKETIVAFGNAMGCLLTNPDTSGDFAKLCFAMSRELDHVQFKPEDKRESQMTLLRANLGSSMGTWILPLMFGLGTPSAPDAEGKQYGVAAFRLMLQKVFARVDTGLGVRYPFAIRDEIGRWRRQYKKFMLAMSGQASLRPCYRARQGTSHRSGCRHGQTDHRGLRPRPSRLG